MSDEIVRWITVNGVHIPIKEGQTADEAIRNKQISLNREEAEKRNQNLPRQAHMPNIPITRANIDNKGVMMLSTKRRFRFVEGSEIRNAYAFCGKGSSKPFKNAEFFADRYKGKGAPSEWQHCAGTALITDGNRVFVREVHWAQGSDGVIREAFIKVRH